MQQIPIGKMNSMILKRYARQGYTVIFNQSTGFLARIEDDDFAEPIYAKHGPELLDISITRYCERNCRFCYRKSSRIGGLISLKDYEYVLKQAQECGVLQVALGGGNPNQHPDFEKILEVTRAKYNIVPSYTTNGDGLTDRVLATSKKYCGAVAISFYEPYNLFYSNLDKLLKAGIRTNVHILMSSKTIKHVIKLLSGTFQKMIDINAVIFLIFKPTGKGNPNEVLRESLDLELFFSIISKLKLKVGFDSCFMPGIVNNLKYNPVSVEACEAGCFSAFITEELMFYPCSFMESKVDGINLRNTSLINAWRKAPLFHSMRNKIPKDKCDNCEHVSVCKGGCVVFDEINLCNHYSPHVKK